MSQELIPYQDIEKMGNAVAKSGLFGLKTPEQAIALMLVAQALGKHPALAAMEYNIIQGRPAKKSEAIQADFQAAGGKIEWHTLTDEKAEATFSHPQGGSLKLDWTIDRAKKANLYEKDGSMYKKYPRQMLKARVVADGVRAVYPAAMGGVRAVEEMDDSDYLPVDINKSRVEQIIDAQSEVKEEPKAVSVEPEKKKRGRPAAIPEGHHEIPEPENKEPEPLKIQGLIEDIKTGMIDRGNGKELKHSFRIEEKYYGTFDKEMSKEITFCADNRVLVNFEYTERKQGEKTLQDITKFSQVSLKDVSTKDSPI